MAKEQKMPERKPPAPAKRSPKAPRTSGAKPDSKYTPRPASKGARSQRPEAPPRDDARPARPRRPEVTRPDGRDYSPRPAGRPEAPRGKRPPPRSTSQGTEPSTAAKAVPAINIGSKSAGLRRSRATRLNIRMECKVCGSSNYRTTRNPAQEGQIVLKKYCPPCNAHTNHHEAK
jgi:large subunit ribosomal protein L33